MNHSPKCKRSLKYELLLLIQKKQEVSFAQLTKRIPSFGGKRALYSQKDPNIVYWIGISPEAENAILELLKEKAIKVEPTVELVYYIDGIVLLLPLVKRPPQGGYKSPHWLPVVLNPV